MKQNEDEQLFQLDKKEMQKIGYYAVDLISEHLSNLKSKDVVQEKEEHLKNIDINENAPLEGDRWENVFQQFENIVLSNTTPSNHPRFFGFVPSPSNYISALAEFLTCSVNIHVGYWVASPGAVQIELMTLNWIKDMFKFPDKAGGKFVSGGSMANLTALAVAKHALLQNKLENAVIYYSDQTHISLDRAIKTLGFQPQQVCKIPCNSNFEISTTKLLQQIQKHKSEGKAPFCIIANIGTTNTGAIDPLEEIVKIASQYGMWVHGDGAFCAPAILSQPEKFKGIEKLDSLTFDPHKWFFQSYDIGCVLIRDNTLLKDSFSVFPEYLKDTEVENNQINFSDYGIELTQRFRALKLWMSMKIFGLNTFRKAINKGIHLTEQTEKMIEKSVDFQLISTGMGVVTFRFVPQNISSKEEINRINEEITKKLNQSGFALVSTTILGEKKVIRICPLHPATTIEDISNTLEKLKKYGEEIPLVFDKKLSSNSQ
ncbi:TPA: aminotransferase class V-fold PLP-dependent enzyme [Bacillus cereus]|nr:aminotransferase class V-fold PLP-dependent enzyme [Bacillus cereus]